MFGTKLGASADSNGLVFASKRHKVFCQFLERTKIRTNESSFWYCKQEKPLEMRSVAGTFVLNFEQMEMQFFVRQVMK
jgi:hypothetical protein